MVDSALKYNLISELLSKTEVEEQELLLEIGALIQKYKERNKKQPQESIPKIPILIFSDSKLGILETIVKYLKENESLRNKEIAKILQRDQRTIWITYKQATKKSKKRLSSKKTGTYIPSELFQNRKLGPLEALSAYLKETKKMTFKEISETLNREYNTIWLSYKKSLKKRGENVQSS